MKITKEMLKKLIKEEMSEAMGGMGMPQSAQDAAIEVMQVIEKHTGITVDLDVVRSMLLNHESIGKLFR